MGLKKYGKGDWRNISRNFVTTRTPTQVASHAQKYFIRQLSVGKDKRRSSIHDITTVNLTDSKSPSPDNRPSSPDCSTTVMQLPQYPIMVCTAKPMLDQKPPNQGAVMVFNPLDGNPFLAPPCGISSHGLKLHDQFLHMGNLNGPQFVPHSSIFQMQSTQQQRLHG